MFDIRFHLGAGQHYKHWQVKDLSSNDVVYYDRKLFYFVMHDCVLKNKRNKAEKVFASQRRDVSGCVRCSSYDVHTYGQYDDLDHSYGDELQYDPKITPFWTKANDPFNTSYDETRYPTLVTHGRRIFVTQLLVNK